jgi:UDP-glucose 4-epimerase
VAARVREIMADRATGFDWAVPPSAKLAIGDAGDQSCVAALIAQHRVDDVLHFAASRPLIETAVKQGLRNFIFSSTAAVYGLAPPPDRGRPPVCLSRRHRAQPQLGRRGAQRLTAGCDRRERARLSGEAA